MVSSGDGVGKQQLVMTRCMRTQCVDACQVTNMTQAIDDGIPTNERTQIMWGCWNPLCNVSALDVEYMKPTHVVVNW